MSRTPLVAAAALCLGASAAPPTFSSDVAPIVFNRCVECHRPGEAAPMSFTSYKEVRPWAKAMRERIVARTMPPWLATTGSSHFDNERKLTDREIATFNAWVEAGSPEGDPRKLPPLPPHQEGWAIGKPDVVFQLPHDVAVPASGVIAYQNYTVDTNFTGDKWIQASEIRPGNRSVVHHIIVFIQEPGVEPAEGRAAARREKLSGFAPGEQPKVFPAGTAKLIKAGSKLVFQMHYTPNGKEAVDRSYVGLIFAKSPVNQPVKTGMAVNASFRIPPGDGNHEVRSSWTAPADVRIIDLMPHMHLRGKDFTYTAVYPDGRSEVVLEVPKYDFNWQLLYRFREPLRLPKGSRLECVAHFDNSPNNRFNPDPSKEVRWGPQTWEEMMIGWFDYVIEPETRAVADGGAPGEN
jgi:hypothetical protein